MHSKCYSVIRHIQEIIYKVTLYIVDIPKFCNRLDAEVSTGKNSIMNH